MAPNKFFLTVTGIHGFTFECLHTLATRWRRLCYLSSSTYVNDERENTHTHPATTICCRLISAIRVVQNLDLFFIKICKILRSY